MQRRLELDITETGARLRASDMLPGWEWEEML